MEVFTVFTLVCMATLVVITQTFIVVPMHLTVVKERLGKFSGVLSPGFHFMIPLVDRAAYRNEMREQPIDVPPQSCITRDNIQVEVDGIVYLKVVDPEKAAYGIGNYRIATINLAQTTMRSEIGKLTLDETFSERERINESIVREIDKASAPWGVKMARYEIRNIDPSARVIETMEKQMEAERERRAAITVSTGLKEARIAISDGERQEAVNLSEGEKQRRINEAEGVAAEIRLLAQAQSEGIRMVAQAMGQPGGQLATRTQLVEQYINELGRILERSQVSVMPAQLANIKGVAEGLATVAETSTRSPEPRLAAPKPAAQR
jgi:regulator of protease activity HflC (stomatin/prohibitin superfamily)